VVISTHNRAHLLPEVLGSLAVQVTGLPFEVIVIDNASTDATAAVLASWCDRDPRFRSASEPRLGLARGKNAGILLSRAPLLLFTDDDILVDPRWIASYHGLLSGAGALTLAGGPIVPIPRELVPWPRWLPPAALQDAGQLDHRERRPLGRFEYVWGGNMAVPRTLFDRLGMWNEEIGLQGVTRIAARDSDGFEDTELQDRAKQAGGAVWFCPEAVVRHRVPQESVTPRGILRTAFLRGRNDVWARELTAGGDARSVSRRPIWPALTELVLACAAWGARAARFRLTRSPGPLELARQAAFRTGRALDSLRAGRERALVYRGTYPLVAVVRKLWDVLV
jgi:glycosyltransferase involved in cell wall biosynthesis